jgi:thiol-disulfide isomerase/thioredoxin
MRNLGIGLVVLALVLSGVVGMYLSGYFNSTGGVAARVSIGQPAPDFELSDKSGKSYSLSSLRGKVVLVNFWATWCPPCRQEMPSMEELYKSFANEGQLELLAINVEEEGPAIIDEFSKEYPHSFPVIFDLNAEVQNFYGVFKFPETFVINKQGIIVERVIGAIDWTDPEVITYLNRLVQE